MLLLSAGGDRSGNVRQRACRTPGLEVVAPVGTGSLRSTAARTIQVIAGSDTDDVALYGAGGAPPVPRGMAGLQAGLHDEVGVDGSERVVLVWRSMASGMVLTLDITEFEARTRPPDTR